MEIQYQNEVYFLGSILQNKDFIHDRIIEPHELTADPRHQSILKYLIYAIDDSKDLEVETIMLLARVATEEDGNLDEIGNISYLTQLQSSVSKTSPLEFTYYQRNIREAYIERESRKTFMQIASNVGYSDNIATHLSLMHEEVERLQGLMITHKDIRLKKVSDIVKTYVNTVYDRTQTEGIVGAPTLSKTIDGMTNGHKKGKFEVVAARPSIGKTAHALNDGVRVAREQDSTSIFFSGEMGEEELLDRMVCIVSNLSSKKLDTGVFDFDDLKKYNFALEELSNLNFYIDDTPGMTIEYIRRTSKKKVKELRSQGIDKIVIYIDYLQLMKSEKKFPNRHEEVTYISNLCKTIARELQVTVVALSQLSRKVEERQDKRPMMSDLRESGAIEQDADIISFLYRDDYYNKQSEKKNIMEIIIGKHRGGPIGTVEMVFWKDVGKLLDIEPKVKEEGSK